MMWGVLLIAAVTALGACAQASAPRPKFEVASIERCRNTDLPSGGAASPGRLDLACVTTANLIRLAYLVFPAGQPNSAVSPSAFQMPISGGPSWINSDRYRIKAKTERPVNVELMKGPMMQALLEDRFRLRFHWEDKQVDVYELTVAKDGPKLRAAKPGACTVFDRNHAAAEPGPGDAPPVICGSVREDARGGFDVAGVTIPDLCRELSKYVDRDIVDKTGMQGIFDVHLQLTRADLGYPGAVPDLASTFSAGDGGAIASAVRKLGLQMRPAKRPAHLLVIDHVERPSGD